MTQFYEDSVFWIDVEKIHPNPFQPRREFDAAQLQSLADSIRQYGVLQALVVTRKEVVKEDGGLMTEYELIAGERRLRASKLAGLSQVPALIKVTQGDMDDLMKLELAIIENIQRQDLNPVERAHAFERLVNEFKFTHDDIGKKVGKSRVFVTNTLRILMLPPEILDALSAGKIYEGHTRPLMMLQDRPAEQMTLFKEVLAKKLSVRETEMLSRRVAQDKVRRKEYLLDPLLQEFEEKFTETLGTRVMIERREQGGKVLIDFFSTDDLKNWLEKFSKETASKPVEAVPPAPTPSPFVETAPVEVVVAAPVAEEMVDDRAPEDIKKAEDSEDLYSIKNFSI